MKEVKQGYKTTEFWMSTAAAVIGILYASDAIGAGSPLMHVLGVASTVLAALGYTVGRSIAKK